MADQYSKTAADTAETSDPDPDLPADLDAGADRPADRSDELDQPADRDAGAEPPLTGRAAFEAAMERKRAAGQARAAHLDGSTGVGAATASHKSSRTFRRKSG